MKRADDLRNLAFQIGNLVCEHGPELPESLRLVLSMAGVDANAEANRLTEAAT